MASSTAALRTFAMSLSTARLLTREATPAAARIGAKRTFKTRRAAPPAAVDGILDTIGNTPVVSVQKLPKPWSASNDLQILLKMESLNPGWSVKARPALNMLEQAEARGELKKGMIISESSSGNTAAALAMACAVKGYRFEPVVDIKMPGDKLQLLEVYGAHPIVVGKSLDDEMAALKIERRELVNKLKTDSRYYIPDQYNNLDNAGAHILSTGPEFVAQCKGRLDLAVVMMSTGGQVGGIGRYIKENIPGCQLLAVEPHGSTIYGQTKGSYLNTGGGLDYKPGVVEGLEDDGLVDQAMVVEDADGLAVCRVLAKHDGMLVGPSTGIAMFAALKAAEMDPTIQRIGLMACDDGRAYMGSIMEGACNKADTPEMLRERVQAAQIETYVVKKPVLEMPQEVPRITDVPRQPSPEVTHFNTA